MEQEDRDKCGVQGRWGIWGGRLGIGVTHRRGDALQLAQGHFVVHAADIPPHVIVLRHCDLHRVGTAVTIPLPTLGVAQGWAQVWGNRGC